MKRRASLRSALALVLFGAVLMPGCTPKVSAPPKEPPPVTAPPKEPPLVTVPPKEPPLVTVPPTDPTSPRTDTVESLMAAGMWVEAAARCEQELQSAPDDRARHRRAAVNWLLAAIALSPPDSAGSPSPEAAHLLDRALAHVQDEDDIRNWRFHGNWSDGYYGFRDHLLQLATVAEPRDRTLALAAARAYPEERPVPYPGVGGPPYAYLRELAEFHPDIPQLQFLGGYAAATTGDVKAAEALFVRADEALQGDRRARAALVQLYDEQGRFDDARRLAGLPAGSGPGAQVLQQWNSLYSDLPPDRHPVQAQPKGHDLTLTPEAPRQFVLAMAWAPDSRRLTLMNINWIWVVDADGPTVGDAHPRQAGAPEPTPPRPAAAPARMAALHWGAYRLCSEAGALTACVYYPWTDPEVPRLRIFDRTTGGRIDYARTLTLHTSDSLGPGFEPQAVALTPDGAEIALLLEDPAHEATVLRILKLTR